MPAYPRFSKYLYVNKLVYKHSSNASPAPGFKLSYLDKQKQNVNKTIYTSLVCSECLCEQHIWGCRKLSHMPCKSDILSDTLCHPFNDQIPHTNFRTAKTVLFKIYLQKLLKTKNKITYLDHFFFTKFPNSSASQNFAIEKIQQPTSKTFFILQPVFDLVQVVY